MFQDKPATAKDQVVSPSVDKNKKSRNSNFEYGEAIKVNERYSRQKVNKT